MSVSMEEYHEFPLPSGHTSVKNNSIYILLNTSSAKSPSTKKPVSRCLFPSPSIAELKSNDIAPHSDKPTPPSQEGGKSILPPRNSADPQPAISSPSRPKPLPRLPMLDMTDVGAKFNECIQQFSATGFMEFRDFITDYVAQKGFTEPAEMSHLCSLWSVVHFTQLRELNVRFPERDNREHTAMYKIGRAAKLRSNVNQHHRGASSTQSSSLVKRSEDGTTPGRLFQKRRGPRTPRFGF